jgi:galactokinase
MEKHLLKEFERIYNQNATGAYFAPGRVNLIGEHIDYNGGLVMPCAITLGTYLLVVPNNEGLFRFRSLNFEQQHNVALQPSYHKVGRDWFNYPLGVIDCFLQDGHQLQGLDMLFYGNIPIGSGLSSSASIEVVTAFAFNELFNAGYSKLELVKIAKSVENNFIGLNSGIMDQFAVVFGARNKAIMLNCDTLEYEMVANNLEDHVLAIIDTNKARKLSGSKYNERVLECQQALAVLKKEIAINYLCEIDVATFHQHKNLITDKILRNRAQHVVEENGRVKQASKALAYNNLVEFGRLMYASHDSLRDLYEVSGTELNTIVDYARAQTFVMGARMTGGGFGGCAIALVKKDAFDRFRNELSAFYIDKIGYQPSIYQSVAGDGVRTCAVVDGCQFSR